MSDRRITVPSFAKINWCLKVYCRRPDGFHELETVLQTISLRDQITFQTRSDSKIVFHTRCRKVATGRDNLVYRAALLLRSWTEIESGVDICLDKRIPVGAGLGGGSSNAAVTLMALNRLWDCRLTSMQLHQLAVQLGSDVPFFLKGGMAAATGRGEQIDPLPENTQPQPVLLLFPGFAVSTAEVFQKSGFPPCTGPQRLTLRGSNTKIRRFRKLLDEKEWEALENDLEAPATSLFPGLKRWKKRLLTAGCRHVLLSGSGSTWLGIGGSPEQIAGRLLDRYGKSETFELFRCRTVCRQEYARMLATPEGGELVVSE